jgi:hypothetical protein
MDKSFSSLFWPIIKLVIVFGLIGPIILVPQQKSQAQSDVGDWTDFENISNTPTASTYPCIASDPYGNIHVFWSEDVGGREENPVLDPNSLPELDSYGNPINYLTNIGNSLFYTRWDGKHWSNPVDIQYNGLGSILYPRAVTDHQGLIHLIWSTSIGNNIFLYYSRAPVDRAGSAEAWAQPVLLTDNIVSSNYSFDIAADPSGNIYVLYSQLGLDSGVNFIKSFNSGLTWSEPVSLFNTSDPTGSQEGISPLRIISDTRGWLHATWTRYGSDGNGKAIYYSQSRDSGMSWSEPFEVAEWQPGWYEVDWLSAGILGNEIHLVWEGSSRVAALMERISYDNGQTWANSNQILPDLVGENGFADLITDIANRMHLLVVKRADAGSLSNGIWYTTLEQDHWLSPVLLGVNRPDLYDQIGKLPDLKAILRNTFSGNGIRYQVSTIVSGNMLFTVAVNEWNGDIWSSHTTLDANYVPPLTYVEKTATTTIRPSTASQPLQTMTPVISNLGNGQPMQNPSNLLNLLILGLTPPVLIIIVSILVVNYIRTKKV